MIRHAKTRFSHSTFTVGKHGTGTAADPFADAGMHLNPNNCPHPYHAGDMPPLFGVNGRALLIFATNRFRIPQIIGKTVIIHARPDDFVTQPFCFRHRSSPPIFRL